MNNLLPRHTLVWPTPAGWTHIVREDPDDEAAGAFEQWFTRDWPLVVRRPEMEEYDDAEIALGLPLPPSHGKRRLKTRLPLSEIARHASPLALDQVARALPGEWQRAALALANDAIALRMRLQAFGSAAWQAITGLPYLHEGSDLDLLFHPRDADEIATMLGLLGHWERTHGRRADGEIVFPDGAAVSWREWRNAAGATFLLVKHLDYATLVRRGDLFARLPQRRAV